MSLGPTEIILIIVVLLLLVGGKMIEYEAKRRE
jgi:Sec-independent protein translocase protein TatA